LDFEKKTFWCSNFDEAFLEGVVSEEGISTGPDKVKTVQDWPRPKTPKQMRGAFLIFAPITGNV
jgi:hypothetical protein